MSQGWKIDTSQELEKLIYEKPLTQESINYVLHNKINKIVLLNESSTAFISPIGTGDEDFNIFIPAKFSLEERSQCLIHEICHAHYEAGGIGLVGGFRSLSERNDRKRMEDLIENESQRFYKENKEFIISIAEKI